MNPGNGKSPQVGGGELVPNGGPPPSGNEGNVIQMRSYYAPTINVHFQCPDCGRGVSYKQRVVTGSNITQDQLAAHALEQQRAAATWAQGMMDLGREISQQFNLGAANIPK